MSYERGHKNRAYFWNYVFSRLIHNYLEFTFSGHHVDSFGRGQLPDLSVFARIGYSSTYVVYALGFEHSAFIFKHESMIANTKVVDEQVEPGALITLLQKSLMFSELETHVRDVGLSSSAHF